MIDHFRFSEVIYLVVILLFLIEIIRLVIFWLSRKFPDTNAPDATPFVSVIIPVRNEEARIRQCLDGITGQSYPQDRYEIIVMDDDSSDHSRDIILSYKNFHPNLKLLRSGAIPDGWGGKSFANHRASKMATGEYLIFMDADVFTEADLLQRVMNHVVKHELDVMSIIPFRILRSFAEKVFLTPLFITIAVAFRDKKVKLSGEYILFRRGAYESIGGHAAIKSTVSDDLDFAAILEKTSFRCDILFAEKWASTRMYLDFSSIYEGISKLYQRMLSENEWLATWRSFKYFLIAIFSVAAPFQYHFGMHPLMFPQWILLLLPTLVLLVFTAFSFYVRINPLYALLMPLGWLFQPVIFYRSLRGKYKRYHVWRGRRVYHNTQQVSHSTYFFRHSSNE
jgi:chlorobactene glucosyltransferase